MKKTIAVTTLLLVSNITTAMPAKDFNKKPQPKFRTVCLAVQAFPTKDKYQQVSCDETNNNKEQGLTIADNGCADKQLPFRIKEPVTIPNCWPPGVVQL